jgi:hypothetical protein
LESLYSKIGHVGLDRPGIAETDRVSGGLLSGAMICWVEVPSTSSGSVFSNVVSSSRSENSQRRDGNRGRYEAQQPLYSHCRRPEKGH